MTTKVRNPKRGNGQYKDARERVYYCRICDAHFKYAETPLEHKQTHWSAELRRKYAVISGVN